MSSKEEVSEVIDLTFSDEDDDDDNLADTIIQVFSIIDEEIYEDVDETSLDLWSLKHASADIGNTQTSEMKVNSKPHDGPAAAASTCSSRHLGKIRKESEKSHLHQIQVSKSEKVVKCGKGNTVKTIKHSHSVRIPHKKKIKDVCHFNETSDSKVHRGRSYRNPTHKSGRRSTDNVHTSRDKCHLHREFGKSEKIIVSKKSPAVKRKDHPETFRVPNKKMKQIYDFFENDDSDTCSELCKGRSSLMPLSEYRSSFKKVKKHDNNRYKQSESMCCLGNEGEKKCGPKAVSSFQQQKKVRCSKLNVSCTKRKVNCSKRNARKLMSSPSGEESSYPNCSPRQTRQSHRNKDNPRKENLRPRRISNLEDPAVKSEEDPDHHLEGDRPSHFFVCGSGCGYETLFRGEFASHIAVCDKAGSLSCTHCSYSAPSCLRLPQHMDAHCHQTDCLYHCVHCQFKTNIMSLFYDHFWHKCKDKGRFICMKCKTVFEEFSQLKRHVQENLLQVVWCRYCDAIACSLEVMQRHLENSHRRSAHWTMNELLCLYRKENQHNLTVRSAPGCLLPVDKENKDAAGKPMYREHISQKQASSMSHLYGTASGTTQDLGSHSVKSWQLVEKRCVSVVLHDLSNCSACDQITNVSVGCEESSREDVAIFSEETSPENQETTSCNDQSSVDIFEVFASKDGQKPSSVDQDTASSNSDNQETISVDAGNIVGGPKVSHHSHDAGGPRGGGPSCGGLESLNDKVQSSVDFLKITTSKDGQKTSSSQELSSSGCQETVSADGQKISLIGQESTSSESQQTVSSDVRCNHSDEVAVKTVTVNDNGPELYVDIAEETDRVKTAAVNDDGPELYVDIAEDTDRVKTAAVNDNGPEWYVDIAEETDRVKTAAVNDDGPDITEETDGSSDQGLELYLEPSECDSDDGLNTEAGEFLDNEVVWLYENHGFFVCNICDKLLSRRFVMHCHLLDHLQVSLGTCSQCNDDFCSNLDHHKCTNWKSPSDVVAEIKRKVSALLGEVRQNGNLVTGLRPYVGTTKLHKNLEQYIDKSGNQSLSNCKLCSACYASKYSLHKHILELHLNITLFSCEVCGFGGIERYNVARHVKDNHPLEALCVNFTPLDSYEMCELRIS